MAANDITAGGFSRRSALKYLGLAGLGAAGIPALAACAPGGGSTTSKALSTSASGSTAKGSATLWFNDDDLLKVFKTVVPSFTAKYPQVSLNLVGVDVNTKLAPTLISGTGVPDGSFAADGAVGAQADKLYDLTALMKPHMADTVQYKLDVNTVRPTSSTT